MDASDFRLFKPSRLVALALIALAAIVLVAVRLAPDAEAVSVPDGAQAGDLFLEACDYETEAGTYEADCGTLVVPENRANPASRLIALPVIRVRALSEQPAEPIFTLWGGPGLTNLQFVYANRFAEQHDVVMVGYRGVDGSVRLDCPEVESALRHASDLLSTASQEAYADGFRACAERLTTEGVDLAGYGLPQRVDDLEAARVALGYERIDLVSESVGTRTAMIYAWRYPAPIHRSVMVAANPPGHFLWDAQTADEQIRIYADLCREDASCDERTDDLAATVARLNRDLPGHWGPLPIKAGNVRIASYFGLMESTSEAAPISGPMTLGSWLSAADGDASGLWFQSVIADLALPRAFVWGEYAATGRLDASFARDYFASEPPEHALATSATAFAWGGGRLVDGWPAVTDEDEYRQVRATSVETLVISGDIDFAVPPKAAREELLPYLTNGHQVTLHGIGHTTSFWHEQVDAGSRLINTFLDEGTIDDSLYEPQHLDFAPPVTQATIGKAIAGTMVGLGALASVSLVWMSVRVSTRRPFGHKASAALRSAHPFVLGLGGWLLGGLTVLVAMPGVPLDDGGLALWSVGMPVGLGVFLAWVGRGSSRETLLAGGAAAVGGALAGTWLGFHAVEGLLALLTSIVGATAGANLALIALDVGREWQERERARHEPIVEPRDVQLARRTG
ncbi:MAG: alpha/beta fold hydrolase [Dehalococcoidia bacterium]